MSSTIANLPQPGQRIVAKLRTWPNLNPNWYENFNNLYVDGNIVSVDYDAQKFVASFPNRLSVFELEFSYLQLADVKWKNIPANLSFLSLKDFFEKEGRTARAKAKEAFQSHVNFISSGCVVERDLEATPLKHCQSTKAQENALLKWVPSHVVTPQPNEPLQVVKVRRTLQQYLKMSSVLFNPRKALCRWIINTHKAMRASMNFRRKYAEGVIFQRVGKNFAKHVLIPYWEVSGLVRRGGEYVGETAEIVKRCFAGQQYAPDRGQCLTKCIYTNCADSFTHHKSVVGGISNPVTFGLEIMNPKSLRKSVLLGKAHQELGAALVNERMSAAEICDEISTSRATSTHKVGVEKIYSVVINQEFPLNIKLINHMHTQDESFIKICFKIRGWEVQRLLGANPPVWLQPFC